MITMDLKNNKNLILVIGKTEGHLDQSVFAINILNEKKGPPPEINLFNEKNNGETVLKLIEDGLVKSAHDVSLGGIITAVSKMAIKGKKGFRLNKLKVLLNKFDYYFGEDQGRYVIEIESKNLSKVNFSKGKYNQSKLSLQNSEKNSIPGQILVTPQNCGPSSQNKDASELSLIHKQ